KAEQVSDWSVPMLDPAQLAYAAQDVKVLCLLRQRLDQELQRLGLERVNALEQQLLPGMVALEGTGLAVDLGRWQQVADAQETLRQDLAARVPAALGVAAFNITQRPQLGDALEAAGVPLPRTPSGRRSTNKKVLRRLRDDYPIVADVLAWSRAHTLSRTFGT